MMPHSIQQKQFLTENLHQRPFLLPQDFKRHFLPPNLQQLARLDFRWQQRSFRPPNEFPLPSSSIHHRQSLASECHRIPVQNIRSSMNESIAQSRSFVPLPIMKNPSFASSIHEGSNMGPTRKSSMEQCGDVHATEEKRSKHTVDRVTNEKHSALTKSALEVDIEKRPILAKLLKYRKILPGKSKGKDTNNLQMVQKKKTRGRTRKFHPSALCLVCGDTAGRHSFYGAQACHSCRAFFRRAVVSEYNLAYFCMKDRACIIKLQQRKKCQYCRYQACLAAGMRPTWVLNEEEKKRFFENRCKRKGTEVSKNNSRKPDEIITEEEVLKINEYVKISEFFEVSKVNDMDASLIRELIRF